VLREGGYLRGCVNKRHCFESVVDQDGVVQSLIRVLDGVQKNVFLDGSHLKRKWTKSVLDFYLSWRRPGHWEKCRGHFKDFTLPRKFSIAVSILRSSVIGSPAGNRPLSPSASLSL
jgi:hypothetical protein